MIIARLLLNCKNSEALIKAKDREGFTPLDLLSSESDLSKLVWIPESLGTFKDEQTKPSRKKISRKQHLSDDTITEQDEQHMATRRQQQHNENKKKIPLKGAKQAIPLPTNNPTIKQLHLQKRFDLNNGGSEPSSKNFALETHLNSFDKERGGSDLLISGFNSTNNLTKIDARKLKLNYGDSSIYSTMGERISLPRISDFKMSKYHSIVLTCEDHGNLFISGSGNRGRLGLGNTQTQDKYVPIQFFKDKRVKCADLSDEHTVVLDSTNKLYSWGMNTYGQLGYTPDNNDDDSVSLLPKQIVSGDLKKTHGKFLGVACSKFHSLAYTISKIYFWGMNIGQFGFSSTGPGSTTKFSVPRVFEFKYDEIKQVCATDNSTIVLNSTDEIHIYLNGFHVKVSPPLLNKIDESNFNIFKPRSLSKKRKILKLITQKSSKNCLMLFDYGDVVQFNIDTDSRNALDFTKSLKFTTVWKASKEHLRCTDVDMSNDGSIIICVKDGSAYKRTKRSTVNSSPSSINSIVSKRYKFTKILKMNKIVKVVSDPAFERFAFVRDDIDLIPHQICKDSILKDFARLSPISELSLDFLQNREIVNEKNSIVYLKKDTFKADYVHKVFMTHRDHEEYDELHDYYSNYDDNEDTGLIDASDRLFISHLTRWTNKPPEYDCYLEPTDIMHTREFLKSDDIEYWLELKELSQNKHYDSKVIVKDTKSDHEFEFGVHSDVLRRRSSIFAKLFNSSSKVFEKNEIRVELFDGDVLISGNVTIRAVAIALHFLYTDIFLDVWNDFPVGNIPNDIQRTRVTFDALVRLLKVVNPLGRTQCDRPLLQDLQLIMSNCLSDSNLVTINLKDGKKMSAFKPLLISRSVYFETLFSERWDNSSTHSSNAATFEDISIEIFNIILRYLSGIELNNLLNGMDEIHDINSFIEFVLDLMKASEQLMLTGLSEICQLYIKDFVNLDNVDILLLHAYENKAKNLQENCLWYMYNNMNVILFENSFAEFVNESFENNDDELLQVIDKSFKWFNNLKYYNSDELNGKTNFMNECSNALIKLFVNDIVVYNDQFLHPFILEQLGPFYDASNSDSLTAATVTSNNNTTKISSHERRRRSSARRIEESKLNTPGAIEAVNKPKSLSFALQESLRESHESLNQSAIADEDENNNEMEEFHLVTNRRKSTRMSSTGKVSPVVSAPQSRSGSISQRQESPPLQTPTPTSNRHPSIGSLPPQSRQSSVASTPSKSPITSSTTAFLSIEESLAVASAVSTSSSSAAFLRTGSSNAAIKIAPSKPKLSQRERQKQMKEQLKEQQEQQRLRAKQPPVVSEPIAPWANKSQQPLPASSFEPVFPWAANATTSPPSTSLISISPPPTGCATQVTGTSSTHLYNLGNNSNSSSSRSFVKEATPPPSTNVPSNNLVPSFEYVLMEEQMKKEVAIQESENVVSLDDIRQEEEFAKWWAEESARVQRETRTSELQSSTSQQQRNNRSNANGGRNNKHRKQQQERKGSHPGERQQNKKNRSQEGSSATNENGRGNGTRRDNGKKKHSSHQSGNRRTPVST